jgi:deoxyribodipyrimidine photo-lyase
MRALMWFRADLRTADNTALHEALREAKRGVVAVFTMSPGQWLEHDWADIKVEFLHRTLRSLSTRLEALNIPVRILETDRFSGAAPALLSLATELGCDSLYFNREYEVNEARRDDAVRAAFEAAGRSVHAYTDQTILAPGEVLTKEGRWYTVFSPFKRAAYRVFDERGGAPVLPAPRKQSEMPCPPDLIPANVRGFDLARGRPDLWKEGEEHARSRLRTFIDKRLAAYKSLRDTPSVSGTSVLSPYLTIGAISPRQCLAAALDANEGKFDTGDPGAAQWISELFWREFYKHLLVAYPRLCMGRAFKPETEQLPWSDNDDHFAAWCEGRTGVPIVDAAMRQLLQTGWMHNRLRMITAMYLTKDLFIDWRRGERFFMRHLVDGDLAPNNGGWQWSASTGTDAAPYFRIFNPVSQSRACDPDGAFIRRFIPELASLDGDDIHEPGTAAPLKLASTGYPLRPIVDHAEARTRVLKAFQALR